jgi:methionyl-tRNA formyltransferase
MALELPVIQPRRLREPEAMMQLSTWQPELIVVAAFGQILRQEVLDLPMYGCINIHASLLPRWRGAAPIQAAILNGDAQTGITIMKMDAGVDTGGILSQRTIPILGDDTAATLGERLAEVGASLLGETLPGYLSGEIIPLPQDDNLATYAPMLNKEDGLLDFNQPARALERRIRALQPWPGAYILRHGEMLKIQSAKVVSFESQRLAPGETIRWNGQPAIATSDGLLVLESVQPAGKRSMSGLEFIRGAKQWGKES